LKVILSGVWLRQYLTLSVFVTKILGISLAIGSGKEEEEEEEEEGEGEVKI
jgi:hypothetical protein